MPVAVIRAGCGYIFSKKFVSGRCWSDVTPTSRIDVSAVGAAHVVPGEILPLLAPGRGDDHEACVRFVDVLALFEGDLDPVLQLDDAAIRPLGLNRPDHLEGNRVLDAVFLAVEHLPCLTL